MSERTNVLQEVEDLGAGGRYLATRVFPDLIPCMVEFCIAAEKHYGMVRLRAKSVEKEAYCVLTKFLI